MPQLLIIDESGETSSLAINTETVTIGRRRSNDLCLPHLSVSGFHARITDDKGCLIIEDRDSTNGTIVNGEKIKTQVLVHLDDIIIGSYRISYSETFKPQSYDSNAIGANHNNTTQQTSASAGTSTIINPALTHSDTEVAAIKVSSGLKAGNLVTLEKPVTTLGRANGDMAAISKRSTGYYFIPVNDELREPMKHNGKLLTPQVEVKLVCGDVIEISGEHLEFILPYRAPAQVSGQTSDQVSSPENYMSISIGQTLR